MSELHSIMSESDISVDSGLSQVAEERLVAWRRHLHAHPELSNQEEQTARYIEAQLEAMGVADIQRVAGTGVVALIEGAHPGATLGWRADIDALPILESNEVAYRSTNPGVMHACGHDVHTSVGLGLAAQLQARRGELHGRVKFIFQPAEEASPEDEPIGAEKMVLAGVLEAPRVDAIFALHCMPTLDVGKIGYTSGGVWAGSDLVEITVHGQKAHGAYPHEGVDAVLVSAHLVCALQSIVSRGVDARRACVVTIGQVRAGNSYNILADRAELTGIVRAFAEEDSNLAIAQVRRIAHNICEGFGASCEVKITQGARPVINDPVLQKQTVDALVKRFGAEEIVSHEAQLGAEDFAAFSREVPGCYLFLGIRDASRGIVNALHTPNFNVDERCLAFGVARFAPILLELGRSWKA
ncbi:M20 metallopeptidase family protein [Bradymonas sediminis]|uniref:Amidohydrolase n=2 Tax=Bradymonas sediminis TaxID=1548548 RepID=A0A2Z4FGP5_9DELT|nr:amidohydrolase [Bradymonas sediminis]AWV88161.1 amidohydrolase [Bradymonas sediminis]TDP77284.1 amidohydrolase/hippurate hydrolase [Bradymonas sediminis]